MKKFFTLVIVSLLSAMAVQAQTLKVTKTDGSVVTYNAKDISKIEFLPASSVSQPKVLHEFTGYLTVTSSLFTNKYYGDAAKIKVLQDGDKYIAQFSDAQWGSGSFDITLTRGQISGSGEMTIVNPRSGEASKYSAEMSGSMTNISIKIPSLMQGVTINWHYGEVPVALKVSGNYSGTTSLMVGTSMGPYSSATVSYTITANEDGTINVTAPQEHYKDIMMVGNLTIGSYVVKNLSYDESSHSFVRNYGKDDVKVYLKSEGGVMSLDKEYSFVDKSEITVKLEENGSLTIKNDYSLARMPMGLSATYTGTKSK